MAQDIFMQLKKQVTLAELLGFLITILTVAFYSWYGISTKIDLLHTRISLLEQDKIMEKEFRQDVKKSFENLEEGQIRIIIQLENKQNRK